MGGVPTVFSASSSCSILELSSYSYCYEGFMDWGRRSMRNAVLTRDFAKVCIASNSNCVHVDTHACEKSTGRTIIFASFTGFFCSRCIQLGIIFTHLLEHS